MRTFVQLAQEERKDGLEEKRTLGEGEGGSGNVTDAIQVGGETGNRRSRSELVMQARMVMLLLLQCNAYVRRCSERTGIVSAERASPRPILVIYPLSPSISLRIGGWIHEHTRTFQLLPPPMHR